PGEPIGVGVDIQSATSDERGQGDTGALGEVNGKRACSGNAGDDGNPGDGGLLKDFEARAAADHQHYGPLLRIERLAAGLSNCGVGGYQAGEDQSSDHLVDR